MKKFYVYQLKTNCGDIIYIGKGSGMRMFKHIKIAKSKSINRSKNPKLYNKILSIINNGGYIIPEVLFESINEELCLEYEIKCIKEIGIENLCNLTEGGEGTSGYKLSEETKKKMSDIKKKEWETRVISQEHKNKMKSLPQLFKKNHNGYWKGKELSEETKKKMSDAKKGKNKGPISEKRRQAIINGIKKRNNN